MALITLADAQLAYGERPLLDHAALAIEAGERVAVIGRNGSGKSSLLRVLAGLEALDGGTVQRQQGLRCALLAQEPEFAAGLNVFDAVSVGLAEVKALRSRFEAHLPGDDLDALQSRIEALDGWTWEQRVEQTLQRLDLDPGAIVEQLSGGTRKQVALARALVEEPDLLLLDEPTNHLDLDAIEWLQGLLQGWKGALAVVSHDRAFIDAVATRVVELDRGVLRSYPGSYAAYEAAKARELEAEALADARADKLLAQEEVWVRQGVEARRTRSASRLARLERLRAERAARHRRIGEVRLELDAGALSGKIVAELSAVSKSFGDRVVVRDFSATILRGDKVGLVGPNGAGKTTLLRLILGQVEPDAGRVRRGTRLQVAYHDQERAALNLDATLADTVSPGSEWITIAGRRRHVMSYLGDFLFSPARANSPLRTLSGGERNRALLARLFALPANVLVLDEPTNDLDIETIELLEDLLAQYPGTVFLVSHDRRFLDAVVTSLIAWEGHGSWREYEGGTADWLAQRERAPGRPAAPRPEASKPSAEPAMPRTAPARPRKLSYKEQRELEDLPTRIEALEAEQRELQQALADPAVYARDPRHAARMHARVAQIDDELTAALDRWEALGG